MSKNNENKLVPRLRFPEFETNGSWELMQIKDIIDTESSTLALNKLELKENGYAVYGADGIVGYIDNFQNSEPFISIVKDGSGVGRLNLCDANTSVLGTLSILKTKNENNFNQVWAYYLLSRINFSLYVKGSGIPHIYFSDYKSEKIGVPNPQEQQKIAACLSSLDEVIAGESQKLEVLKEHKKGLLQNLFPQQGETVPKLRFKEFENSGEWVESRLDDICKFIRGPFGGALKKEIFVNDGYAVYEQSHAIYGDFTSFRYFITEKKYNELKRFAVQPYDIIMSCSGTMGKFAIVPEESKKGVINQALLKLTVRNGYDTDFIKSSLELPLNQNKLLSQAAGGAIKNVVEVAQIKEIKLSIPSIEEQKKIASFLSSIDDLMNAQSQKIETLKLHKKGLLQGLFPDVNEHNG